MFDLTTAILLIEILLVTNASVTPTEPQDIEILTSYEGLPIILVESQPNKFDTPVDFSNFEEFTDKYGNLLGKTKFYETQFPKVIFFCPKQSSDDRFALYPKKFADEDPLVCEIKPNPVIRKVTQNGSNINVANNEDVLCGLEQKGILYKYIYELYFDENEVENLDSGEQNVLNEYPSELEIYKICYDHSMERVLYTNYQIKSPLVLQKDAFRKERGKYYDIMTEGYEYFGNNFVEKKALYDQLEDFKLKEPVNSRYNFKYDMVRYVEFPYEAQPLVNANDMAFASLRKPTFHYINLDLINKELKKTWDTANFIIKMKAMEEPSVPFTVYTATFIDGIYQKSYLNGKLQVPHTWIKIVIKPINPSDHEEGYEGTAIIMNNIKENGLLYANLYHSCGDSVPMDHIKAYFKRVKSGDMYVRYCTVTEHFKKFFDMDVKIVGTILTYNDGISKNTQIPPKFELQNVSIPVM